jgi:hypothetical protein
LLIGVNNQYRGPSRGFTLDGYREEFAELLQMAIALAGGDRERVLVVSIPDYGVTPFVSPENKDRVGKEIDQYNAVNLEESQKAGVRYADITPISRMAVSQAGTDCPGPTASVGGDVQPVGGADHPCTAAGVAGRIQALNC